MEQTNAKQKSKDNSEDGIDWGTIGNSILSTAISGFTLGVCSGLGGIAISRAFSPSAPEVYGADSAVTPIRGSRAANG